MKALYVGISRRKRESQPTVHTRRHQNTNPATIFSGSWRYNILKHYTDGLLERPQRPTGPIAFGWDRTPYFDVECTFNFPVIC